MASTTAAAPGAFRVVVTGDERDLARILDTLTAAGVQHHR